MRVFIVDEQETDPARLLGNSPEGRPVRLVF